MTCRNPTKIDRASPFLAVRLPTLAFVTLLVWLSAQEATSDQDLLAAALPEPPVIQTHPQSRTVSTNATVSFAVEASGTPPLTYQWRLNGIIIPNATGPVLTLTNVQPADGGTYRVAVANAAGTATSDPATLIVTARPLVLADNLADRMVLEGPSWTGSGTNIGATLQPGEGDHVGVKGGSSVWLGWVAPGSGVAALSTRGSTFDTLLAVYVGNSNSLTNLTTIAADEDSGGFYTSQTAFNAIQGTEYFIAVDGFSGATGQVVLTLELEENQVIPQIIQPPLSQTVLPGSEALFMVVATNPPSLTPLSYQWQFNGTDIPGATNAALEIVNVQPDSVGHYRVLVTNTAGRRIASREAILEIGPNPRVLSRDKLEDSLGTPALAPASLRASSKLHRSLIAPISPGIVSVSAGTITIQHFDNIGAGKQPGEPDHCGLLGGASKFLDFNPAEDGIVIVDTPGSEIDTILAVYRRVSLSRLSANLIACEDPGTSGGSQVRFQALADEDYRAFVDGANGAQGRITIRWRLGLPPRFIPNPETEFHLNPGEALELRAETHERFPPTHYQWFHNGTEIAGATNATLTLDPILPDHTGSFSIEASNEFGTATTTVANLTVLLPYLEFEIPAPGFLRLTLPGSPEQFIKLESSSDLIHWSPFHLQTNSTEPFSIDIPTSTSPRGFYRALPWTP